MPRPKRCRRVGLPPGSTLFKPAGVPARDLDEVVLAVDEFEALRLADYQGLYHEQAAERMGISRQTFGRIVETARKKVAQALVMGLALRIQSGQIDVSEMEVRTYFDQSAGTWDNEPRRIALMRAVGQAILREAQPTSDMDVLDYGCGTGLVSLFLLPHVRSVTGADNSPGNAGRASAEDRRGRNRPNEGHAFEPRRGAGAKRKVSSDRHQHDDAPCRQSRPGAFSVPCASSPQRAGLHRRLGCRTRHIPFARGRRNRASPRLRSAVAQKPTHIRGLLPNRPT